MKRKITIATVAVVLLLVITNPSVQDFKENGHYGANYRQSNYLVFSVFANYQQGAKTTYVGICKNFFKLKD